MLQSKSYVKKTKRGKVLKVVREHYLRDDISSGTPLDEECDPATHTLSPDAPHYVVMDTNIALHQMDVLEHAAVKDVIVASVVLNEVKARNTSVYQRLRALIASPTKRFYVFANEHHRETYITAEPGESPNDRNDRAIRVVAAWYAARIPTMPIILLTDDAGSRAKVIAESKIVKPMSTAEYAKLLAPQAPELVDIVARSSGNGEEGPSHQRDVPLVVNSLETPKGRAKMYEDHRPMSEITAGLRAGRYHQGTLRTSRYDPYEGLVGSDAVGRDIVISGKVAMNRAFDGDVVAVELLPNFKPEKFLDQSENDNVTGDTDTADQGVHVVETVEGNEDDSGTTTSSTSFFGKVVGIIKRSWRARGYCGSLKPPATDTKDSSSGSGQAYTDERAMSVLFMPVDRRYPMIRIQTRQAKTLSDKRFVVVVDGWEVDSAYPQGHYVKTIGEIGDRDVETEVLLIEHDVNTAPFAPAVYDCLPALPWTLSEADVQGRLDLRDLVVCSVDPPGCKDIDDALHVRRLPSGMLELGVHIADVTHFVHPGTPLDAEAAVRATTTYLVQRRIDMLPKALTEDICSLRAGVDRLAFSVLWEVTEGGELLGSRFAKSVIRSRAALTYAEAQSRIDDDRVQDEVTEGLRMMNRLAKIFRQRRIQAGALQLASPEVKFEIDTETHDPLDVGMYMVRETNQMVEEMMLLANCTVAEKCLAGFPGCSLLRRHPTPPSRQFEPLLRAAAAVGVAINPETSKTLAESLDRAVRADDPYFNKLIRIAATRCMTQAIYFSSGDVAAPEYHHYGLAAPLYTHFTSPIRRYADVIVHRVLMATLGLVQLPETQRDGDLMHGVIDNLNNRHRNAQLAGRASVELHTLIFFKDRQVIADARITKVKSNKTLLVFVPKYGIEGPVHFVDNEVLQNSGLIFDEEKQTVVDNNNGISRPLYTVFDQCAVRITVKEGYGKRRWLSLELVDRSLLPASEQVV